MPSAWHALRGHSSNSSDSTESPSSDLQNNNIIIDNNDDDGDDFISNSGHEQLNVSTSRDLPRRRIIDGGNPNPPRPRERAKPHNRRGHTKSRLGCLCCKRRRVKCNEARPACSACIRLGLACIYPPLGPYSAEPPPSSLAAATTSAPTSSVFFSYVPYTSVAPQRALPTLTMQDLRFYHHFLTVAYPTMPMRSPEVWMDVGAMSHQFGYLSHSLLALGATHLSVHGNVDYTEYALHHRVAAMKLANEQLIRMPQNVDEADALFATLFCLLAQSSHMPGGLYDFVTVSRGVFLVLTSVLPEYKDSIFRFMVLGEHAKTISQMASKQPPGPAGYAVLDGFKAAAMAMEPLCRTQVEKEYLEDLIKPVHSAVVSAASAWFDYIAVFCKPSVLTNQEYDALIHPDNHIGYLLMIHSCLLDYVLGRFCIAYSEMPKLMNRKMTIIYWARSLAQSLPVKYKPYMNWALDFCDELERSDGRYLLTP